MSETNLITNKPNAESNGEATSRLKALLYGSKPNVLIACEYSGIVREAFNAVGLNAISCDLRPTELPGKHVTGDVRQVLDYDWDCIIAHPPCTYLSNAGGHYLQTRPGRMDKMEQACVFFNMFFEKADLVCIENPIQHGEARKRIRKYNQIIQPYQFGDAHKKTTCLWYKGLPPLLPTHNMPVKPKGKIVKSDGRNYYYWYHQGKSSKERARFFPGIARAMAEQWKPTILEAVV